MTDHVIVIHRVADYATWRTHFDAAAELRSRAGEEGFEVLRSADDPNTVVHSARWSSVAAARRFFESPEVAAIRRRAGVETPTFLYLTLTDAGGTALPPG
jgi:heme-degrading monooxygenase HmoA